MLVKWPFKKKPKKTAKDIFWLLKKKKNKQKKTEFQTFLACLKWYKTEH